MSTVLMSNQSWQFSEQGIWQWQRRGEDHESVMLFDWCPMVEEVVIRRDDDGGEILARQYLVRVADHVQLVSHRDLQSGECWQFFPAAGGMSKPAYPVLMAIVTQQATKAKQVIGRPQCDVAGLALPPDRYLPGGYGRHTGTDDGLRALAEVLAPHPYASLLLGLSAVSHLVRPAGLQPAWWCLLGDTTTGKTTLLRALASLWGLPQGTVRGFSGTLNGLAGHLRDLAVLPAFWDELGASDMKPSQTLAFVMSTCEGAYRSARNRDDTARRGGSWHSYAFASGNRPLTDSSSPGLGARLIELMFSGRRPAIPADCKAKVQQITNRPDVAGSWIEHAERIRVTDFLRDLDITSNLPEFREADSQVGAHMVKHLSAALVGCSYISDMTEVTGLWDSALIAAREVMEGTADRLSDLGGGNPGEDLLAAVEDDKLRRPAQWERQSYSLDERRTDLLGWREGDLTHVRPSALQEIARRAGIESLRVALNELREQGRLVTVRGKGCRNYIRIDGAPTYLYTFTSETNGNGGNNGNSAGQSTDGNGNGPAEETATAGETATATATATGQPVPVTPETTRIPEQVDAYAHLDPEQQRAFRMILEDATLSDDLVVRGLKLWHQAVRVGDHPVKPSPRGAGLTGANVYRMLAGRHASMPPLPDRCEDPPVDRPPTTVNWLHPDAAERLADAEGVVTAVDVNAQFLAAASSTAYPLGDWERVEKWSLPEFRLPGYARIAEDAKIPLPYPAGTWVSTPAIRYLQELGRAPAIDGMIVWKRSRRVLAPWTRVFRQARDLLMDSGWVYQWDDGPEAARVALSAVKQVSNRFLSGWMVSDQNRTEFMRPEWADMTIGTARTNAMRAIAKVDTPTVLGVFTDTVFFAGSAPGGLEYTTQPGKWKIVGTVHVDESALSSPAMLFRVVRHGLS